jgi:hypothetical protein
VGAVTLANINVVDSMSIRQQRYVNLGCKLNSQLYKLYLLPNISWASTRTPFLVEHLILLLITVDHI